MGDTTRDGPDRAESVLRQMRSFGMITGISGGVLVTVFFLFLYPSPGARGGAIALDALPPAVYVFVAALWVVVLIGARAISYRAVGAIDAHYRALAAGAPMDSVPEKVRQLALDRPRREALASLAVWALAAAAFGLLALLLSGQAALAGQVALGTIGVGGVFASGMTFFGADVIWRRAMPAFFPSGLPPGRTGRRSMLGRLLMAFALVGVWPPVVLAVVALQRAAGLPTAADPDGALHDLGVVVGFIVLAGLSGSLVMALLVTRGIVGPVHALQEATAQVERGDLQAQAQVVTSDELGYLADRFNHMTAGLRERERLRDMFGQYVSRRVADAAVRGELAVGGERREVTVLISDLRDFTRLAEATPPEILVRMLNRYLEGMVDAVLEFDGTLDKFVGDSVVVMFNAPLAQEAHPLLAVRTAVRMRERLAMFNEGQKANDGPLLRMGIGLHTGSAVVGNVGAAGKRVEYTAVGDTVNVAARLEGLTKELGVDICLGEATYMRVRPHVIVDQPVTTQVKGRQAPLTVYPLLGLRSGGT